MAILSLEERMTALEAEVAQLKQQLATAKSPSEVPWWQQISGIFKDDPDFEEAMRLGREWRESQQPDYDEDDTAGTESAHGPA